jgi:NAD(P)-dependent dehydrogenase (short-subunit alcohol dehydrogenase family)
MAKSIILITGCDSGFGMLLANKLLEAHPDLGIVACYHSTQGLDSGPKQSSRVLKHQVDITSDESVEKLRAGVVAWLTKNKASLVGVVNNAGGLLVSGPIEWSDPSQDEAQMDLNFMGTVRITKAFLSLIRQSRGRIVNVSSILGLVASPFGSTYAASKFAVEGWTDSLRREMLPFGVRVSLIEPGIFSGTEFYKRFTVPVEEGWDRLDDSIKTAYGSHYKEYVIARLVKLYRALGTSDPNRVVNCMEHALVSTYPKRRYRVGLDCVVLAKIIQWLPTCLADLVLTVADVVVALDWSLKPQMPSKSLGSHWVSIVRFALGAYSSFPLLLLGLLVVAFLAFIVRI